MRCGTWVPPAWRPLVTERQEIDVGLVLEVEPHPVLQCDGEQSNA
jgi:hypothetical protein